MSFNFDWNYVSSGAPYVTISYNGLAFNSPSINLLGEPDEIVVGFDEKAMAIGVKDAGDMENVKRYKFKSRIKNGWVRIGCKDFVKYLSDISGIDFNPAKKYIAHYDKDEKYLYITVKKEVKDSDPNTK